MKELLDFYYQGFAEKGGWESVIAEDFHYIGGDMTKEEPIVGKQAFIEVINRFSRIFTRMHVKKMIIQDKNACVIGNYDFRFPTGKAVNGNVAEIWTSENGKLQCLRIYFDTLTFAENLKK